MRALADRGRIEGVMEAFGRAARGDVRIHLVGGATAVLLGWRPSTIDVDLVMRPEDDALLREIPRLKEALQVNLELASPLDFIPVPPGWEDRGTFITRKGKVSFFHFDLYGPGAGEGGAGRIAHAMYSSGKVGRLTAGDALTIVKELRK